MDKNNASLISSSETFEKRRAISLSVRKTVNIYMLFTGREGRIGKNCARGLEYGPRPAASGRTQGRGPIQTEGTNTDRGPIRTDQGR